MPRANQVSRKVSWLLRHGAEQEGLKLGKGGYVSVADAVSRVLSLWFQGGNHLPDSVTRFALLTVVEVKYQDVKRPKGHVR